MKTYSKIAALTIFGITLVSFSTTVFADTIDPGSFVPSLGPTTVVTPPNTTVTGTNGSEVGLVVTTGSNGAEAGNIVLVGSNSNEVISTPSTPTTPDAPVTPPTPTPSIGGGSSFSSSGSSGSYISLAQTSTTTSTTSPLLGSCPLITTFMQFGANNDSGDVAKLQAFLKNTENLNVDLTGIFDAKTEAAVKAFQTKYLSDIMGPWKTTTPSGFVYITTKKKINEISCNSTINLNAQELATINSYVQGNQNQPSVNTPNTTGTVPLNPVGPTVPTTTPIIGENTNNGTANVAAVGNASVLQNVWNFIKGIFGR